MNSELRAALEKPFPGVSQQEVLSPDVCSQLHSIARDRFPNEMVGYVAEGRAVELGNISPTPEKSARICQDDMFDVLTRAEAMFHSHPGGPDCPSAADMVLQHQMAIPHILISVGDRGTTNPFCYGREMERPGLIRRGFLYNQLDCQTLFIDFYARFMGIELPQFFSDWEWWMSDNGQPRQNLYVDNVKPYGFRPVPADQPLEFGDVILLKAGRTKVPNHLAVYIGEGLMLHHLGGMLPHDPSRLSTVEPVVRWQTGQRWEMVVRHWG